jgi:hypothetical protein
MKIHIRATRVFKTMVGMALGVVVSTAIALPFTGTVHESTGRELYETYGSMLFLASYMLAIFAVPVGLVGHAILSALKQNSLLVYAALGGVAGLLFSFWMGGGIDWLQTIILYSLWAAGCAAIAWLIRRPDKDGDEEAVA